MSLIRRTHGDHSVLLAAKQYRDAQHRMFHRDAGYLEGRRMRTQPREPGDRDAHRPSDAS